VIGAGGLGSPAGLYLAAAGVGTIGVADGDVVDLTNLQRQIAHGTADVDRPKTDSIADAIRALNPDVAVECHPRLTPENLPFDRYDVILDGSDNFETRFMVNDEAVRVGVPLVSAAVLRFEGQMTTVLPGEGRPCYRCLYPGPPPEGSVPTCSQAGVLGSVAGTMGTLQATEAIKVLIGVGGILSGTLLVYDALAGSFRSVRYARDPACGACGTGD
jgi:adenylyltransferase/sulfurtransferase